MTPRPNFFTSAPLWLLLLSSLAGCFTTAEDINGEFSASNVDDKWLLDYLEDNKEKQVHLLWISLEARAVDSEPFTGSKRIDHWDPGYILSDDGAIVTSTMGTPDLWEIPSEGSLVVWQENMESPGWERDRWWKQARQPGYGDHFEWLGSRWSMFLDGKRFVELSGGPFGAQGNHLTLAPGEQSFQVTFTESEWWLLDQSSVQRIEVAYEGTLTFHNYGQVTIKLPDQQISLLEANPESIRATALREAAHKNVRNEYPPLELLVSTYDQ